MTLATTILEFGCDPDLLRIRGWVLQSKGYRVAQTTYLDEVGAMVRAERPAVLLLCHTLPFDLCQQAQQIAGAEHPPVPCLVLLAGPQACPFGEATTAVVTAEGPTKFLSAVERLVDNTAQHPHHIDPQEGSHGAVRRQRSLV